MNEPIGIAGLSHLGLCTAIGSAAKGATIVAFDPDATLIAAIKTGQLPVNEPGLEAALAEHGCRIAFTSDPAHLTRCAAIYVAVDVPTDDGGASDSTSVGAIVAAVTPRLRPTAALVILSQVSPGYTRQLPVPHDRLYCQVETLIFGRALERVLSPERFILGCADPSRPLPAGIANYLGRFGCPVLRMRYESAELAKIAINCLLAASVSTTNTLAELAGAIGADWAEIAPALRLDARIGPKAYLAAGLGIAGGNLERDLATVRRLATRAGTDAGVIAAFAENSRHMAGWAWRMLRRALADRTKPRIGVLGLAYKPGTNSVKNSPSLALLRMAREWSASVHDPVVPGSVAPGTSTVARPEMVAEGADAVLVMTPWDEYRALDLAALATRMRGRVMIDPYRLFDGAAVDAAGLDHYAIGRPPMRAPDG